MDMFLAQEGGVAAGLAQFTPFIFMMIVFYFLLIRPQQQQQKRRQELLASLKRGDKVITVGGIHGEITELRDDVITLRIAENVDIRVSRAGISVVKGKE
ncbi:MAG: preprotein translocase subunit YajC [Limnochordia bacterium]